MSISTWFDKRQKRHREKQIMHHRKHIKTRFGQGEDRFKAIDFFRELGGKQGALGLLERFMVNVEPSIRDEDEKERVFKILLDYGPDVVAAVEEYLNRKDAANVPVTWPLKVLDAVCEPRDAVSVIIRTLDKMGISYMREPERKQALVRQLAEYDDDRVVQALIPFLQDHRDEVQIEALGALEHMAREEARESILDLLVDEETPIRVKASAAEALKNLGWTVKGYRKKVEEALPEGLSVDRSGRIKGRWKRAPQDDD